MKRIIINTLFSFLLLYLFNNFLLGSDSANAFPSWTENTNIINSVKHFLKNNNITDFTISDIKVINKKMYIVGLGHSDKYEMPMDGSVTLVGESNAIILGFDNNYKIHPKTNDTLNVSLCNTDDTLLVIQHNTNNNSLHKEISEYSFEHFIPQTKYSLKPVQPSNSNQKISNIIGNYNKHYWICDESECEFNNDVSTSILNVLQKSDIVGFEQPETNKKYAYWVKKNNMLYRAKVESKTLITPRNYSPGPTNLNLASYKLLQILPYSSTNAVGLYITPNREKGILHITLNSDNYTLEELNKPDNLETITLKNIQNPIIYALIKKGKESNILTISVDNLIKRSHALKIMASKKLAEEKKEKENDLKTEIPAIKNTESRNQIIQKTPILEPIDEIDEFESLGDDSDDEYKDLPEENDFSVFSEDYTTAFSHTLNGMPNEYISKKDNKKYVLKRGINSSTLYKVTKAKTLSPSKTIPNSATIIGIVPGRYGDQLVLTNKNCTWVNPVAINHLWTQVMVPNLPSECTKKVISEIVTKKNEQNEPIEKYIIENGEVYVTQYNYGIEHSHLKTIEKKISYQKKAIKAATLVEIDPSIGEIGIITKPFKGRVDFLIVKKTQQQGEIPVTTLDQFNKSNTTTNDLAKSVQPQVNKSNKSNSWMTKFKKIVSHPKESLINGLSLIKQFFSNLVLGLV